MELSTHVGPREEGFGKLYRSLKPIVWVENADSTKGKAKEEEKDEEATIGYITGFTVSKDGLVMTCAHAWGKSNMSDVIVHGRRLDEAGFEYTLKVQKIQKNWDVVLLKAYKVCKGGLSGFKGGLSELSDCMHGKFAQDGSLQKGETVMMIGHPDNLIGSCLLGTVAFSCVEHVTLSTDLSTCIDFKSDACANTPRYRMMGHIGNGDRILEEDDFVQQFYPNVPIIQCNGLKGSPGTSGSPIFNTRGEIVGMGIMGVRGFDVGVHVTLLRHFLET